MKLSLLIEKAAGLFRPTSNAQNETWRSLVHEPFPGAWQRNMELDRRDALMGNSAVYACTTRIANDIAKLPINLVEKIDDIWTVVDRQSPFWRPLIKPNLVQNRIQFYSCWLLSKLMYGNTYILKERDAANRVARLYVLPPAQVAPLLTPDGSVFYRYKPHDVPGLPDGKEVVIPASEIIHDLMNPLFHPLVGVPPLFAAAMTATGSTRIQNFSARLYENMARPSGILTTASEMTEAQSKQLKEQWETNYSGSNIGRIAVGGGGLKFEPVGWPAEQMQLIEQLKWGVEDIARPYHMPLHKIGAGATPTSNNVEALNQQYYDDCLQIHIEAIELCLDEGLGLTNVSGQTMGVEFDLDNLLRMDSATQINSLAQGTGAGIYSINEARRRRNLPPTKGGETPYLQQQNWPLEQLAEREPPTVTPNEALPPPKLPPPDEQEESEADKAMKLKVLNAVADMRLKLA